MFNVRKTRIITAKLRILHMITALVADVKVSPEGMTQTHQMMATVTPLGTQVITMLQGRTIVEYPVIGQETEGVEEEDHLTLLRRPQALPELGVGLLLDQRETKIVLRLRMVISFPP